MRDSADPEVKAVGAVTHEIRLVGGPEHGATWELPRGGTGFGDGERLRIRGHVYVVDTSAAVGVCAGAA